MRFATGLLLSAFSRAGCARDSTLAPVSTNTLTGSSDVTEAEPSNALPRDFAVIAPLADIAIADSWGAAR